MNDLRKDLGEQITQGRVLLVVGARVSMGATGGALAASWRGLLESGVERCEEVAPELPEGWGERRRGEITSPDLDELISAAEQVNRKLGGPGGAEYRRWLRETVGALEAREPATLEALRDLAAACKLPIATTNYDRLLEEVTGHPPVTWRQPAEVVRVLRGEEEAILHLHGDWKDPESVVLGVRSYDELLGNVPAQTVQQVLALTRGFVFVGCGGTFDDPNFTALLTWLRQHFGGVEHRHFRLCLDQEEAALKKEHANDRIYPVPFGEGYGELPGFLRSLIPPARARRPAKRKSPKAPKARNAAPREADLTPYLQALVSRTDDIRISGIVTTATRGAPRYEIEKLYTPLTSRVGLQRAGLEAATPEALTAGLREGRVRLPQLLPLHRRLLLQGQPGAGKTTFLRYVACMLARDRLGVPCPEGTSWRRRYLGLDERTPPRVPVLLRVSELVARMLAPDAPRHRYDNRLWLLGLLERSCQENAHPVPREQWQRLLEKGEALLLLDGLDEAADERLRERIFEIFRDACHHWRCPVVVTSRPLAPAVLLEMGFHSATIDPFGEAEIRTFIDHWVAGLHGQEAEEAGAEALRYREALLSAITGRSRVRRLATNPVMLTCLCVVHWNEGRLPEGRSRVYRAVLRWLLAARTDRRRAAGFTDLFAHRAFAALALAMMSGPKGKRAVVDLEEAAEAVAPLFAREKPALADEDRRHEARRWLLFECLGSGIVEEVAGRRLRFWHLTFQESLAALQFAWMRDGEKDDDEKGACWWPLVRPHLDDAQWRETVELFPGTLLDEGGVGRVDLLLERVLALQGEEPDLAIRARVAGVLGRLLEPLAVLDYQPSPAVQAAYDEALEESMAIFTREGAAQVAVEDRIAAAEALGQGGDPRLTPGVDNFIEVPGLEGLRLGRYPVTVEEYQRFVEEGRGYEEEQRRFWSPEGWEERCQRKWAAPGGWDDQLRHPNRPVVGVSWYEAEAYCRWLTVQRGGGRREVVRLPTQAEREKAATPKKGEYPWGAEEPDPERANFGENVGEPTPVGIYPTGDGPHGHSDLAGNVWEWCADEVEVPWAKEEVGRALRGGGWGVPAEALRAAFRLWVPAWRRDDSIGFRVAVSPPSR